MYDTPAIRGKPKQIPCGTVTNVGRAHPRSADAPRPSLRGLPRNDYPQRKPQATLDREPIRTRHYRTQKRGAPLHLSDDRPHPDKRLEPDAVACASDAHLNPADPGSRCEDEVTLSEQRQGKPDRARRCADNRGQAIHRTPEIARVSQCQQQ